MAKLSVIIPSRQEKYLYQTIRDCFAKAAGEVEVVVHLDGYWPDNWGQMTAQYPNLQTVHSGEAIGMRPGINKAAGSAISRGAKYLFKLDAHCMLDEGYDLKLQADMDDDWVVVPRRKRLDAENWQLQDVGKPDIDYHYLSFPNDPDDWGGPGLNGKPWTERILERLSKPEYDIDDECSSQGSAWLMTADYFQKLELMDADSYGPFWNEAQELFLKCWLSGGRGVINKKTWYAHLRKGKEYEGADGKKGRGYTLPESWLKSGRDHTMKWIWNEAWDKQTLPFKWLIEKFPNMPGWPDNWEEVLYATRKPRVLGVGVDSDNNVPSNWQPASASSLMIISAYYGPTSLKEHETGIDVTARLQALVRDNSLDIIVNNSTLTPDQNPFRGRKKQLQVAYAFVDADKIRQIGRLSGKSAMGLSYILNNSEAITRTVEEKDWLIIGPVADTGPVFTVPPADIVERIVKQGDNLRAAVDEYQADFAKRVAVMDSPPTTPAALNDYLIRKFSISPQRLRGPMPIELRDFHRNDLAQLFAELGFKRGAEIGVAEGLYSEVLMKANPTMELLCVDPWHSYSGNPQNKTKEKNEYAYNEAKRRLCQPDWHVKLIPLYSMDAVRDVDDNSLDFVYIDGHHSYPYVMCDIIEWTKKVRTGGIVALDDIYKLNEKWGAGPMEAIYDYTRAMRINPWWLIAAHKSVDAFFVKP